MKKINTIIEWVNEIKLHKTNVENIDDDSWKCFNVYMVHRFLSMNKDLIDVVNFVQRFNNISNKNLYKLYCELIPKTKSFDKYIKSSTTSNEDLLLLISKYYDCSTREVQDYINIIDTITIQSILESFGLSNKEIKSLTKNLK